MELALLVLLIAVLIVGSAALAVGVLMLARLRVLLGVARSARQEVQELSSTVTTNVVNVVERRGLRPPEDVPLESRRTPPDAWPRTEPAPSVQDRADEEPTETYAAVRPEPRPSPGRR